MVGLKALHPLVALAASRSVRAVAALDGACILVKGAATACSDAVSRTTASSAVLAGRQVQASISYAGVSVAARHAGGVWGVGGASGLRAAAGACAEGVAVGRLGGLAAVPASEGVAVSSRARSVPRDGV